MKPSIWGRPGWKFLYSIALGYPKRPNFQEIHNYKRFFTYLQYVLPCSDCRVNYAKHLYQIPIDPYLTSRYNLFNWVLQMNNLVNKESGKPLITRKDVFNKHFQSENKEKVVEGFSNLSQFKQTFSIILLIALLALVSTKVDSESKQYQLVMIAIAFLVTLLVFRILKKLRHINYHK